MKISNSSFDTSTTSPLRVDLESLPQCISIKKTQLVADRVTRAINNNEPLKQVQGDSFLHINFI